MYFAPSYSILLAYGTLYAVSYTTEFYLLGDSRWMVEFNRPDDTPYIKKVS
jgi:hypothetical protein